MLKCCERIFLSSFIYTQIGCSIKGLDKEENQDCFQFYHDDACVIAVVADGLGSALYSGHGSQVICQTAMNLLKNANLYSDLGLKIREEWIQNIVHKPVACDTTLKFVKITRDKAVYGGIGDGWLAFLVGDTYSELVIKNTFSNQTDTILSSQIEEKFVIKEIFLDDKPILFLVATDGFSEDIDKDKAKAFLEGISISLDDNESAFLFDLENVINDWPVRTNCDDKTVVLLQRKAQF